MVQLNEKFESIAAARTAITKFVLDQGESYKLVASDKKRYIICCKDSKCKFRIRATRSAKEVVSITIFEPHSCTPATHYKSRQHQSVKYLVEHHRAAIIDNRNISPAQIRSNERLQFSNNITYLAAYRTIQAVINEMYGEEAESFAKFPALAERFIAADPDNYVKIRTHSTTGHFQAAFFAPAATRHAVKSLRRFFGIDGTHTSSRFRMTLLIAGDIDANDEVLPLAWALVPIENKAWWIWFLRKLRKVFHNDDASFRTVFMSDREKGLPGALDEVYPEAIQGYCCQHIANNIQAQYGIKCVPLFWPCARAKTEAQFKVALDALIDQSVNAGNYVRNIPHKFWAR